MPATLRSATKRRPGAASPEKETPRRSTRTSKRAAADDDDDDAPPAAARPRRRRIRIPAPRTRTGVSNIEATLPKAGAPRAPARGPSSPAPVCPSRPAPASQAPASQAPASQAPASPAPAAVAAAPAHEYEFGGPAGACATMVLLPAVILGLGAACGETFCVGPSPLAAFKLPELSELFSLKSFAVVVSWILFQAVLQLVLPGEVALGAVLRDGQTRLPYKINGHLAFWVSLALMGHGWPEFDEGHFVGLGKVPLAFIYDDFLSLAVSACVVAAFLSTALYVASFRASKPMLALPGSTGCGVYDFFMGRELNPRLGSFDLKCFCELRPGLIGWIFIDMGFVMKQAALRGSVSAPMWVVVAFHCVYVWDALYSEKAILTTMDITTDGFGYMLAFGDLAWVPFTYCLQARFLVTHDPHLGTLALACIVLLNCAGYAIFRGANGQKDFFRSEPEKAMAAGIQWMPTKRGTKLIVSGFWGAARKINYTGDWLMSLSWCLTTGFVSPIPYFYCTYFAVLLVHRALRDDHACAAKYGDDWPEYKKRVPYLFIPYVV
ncbi:ergosterol biosynthesis ERG4/ERG24 family-domain-containing protein [Pelagophyceae sp. CCMP2097]|nr:ergosterol biosynthesis ERG4/ERG24 family-domain-containing protein [Pelagophyceae sp. CCMP2097]